ncbi:GlxA family transcriptional regulator [Psychromonas ossibalaenae]|uniref:GlxA family transcriptional regulator n=1 Tax=Psychromonas ossibalaenae TaxID=444922 RepID=UPI0003624A31|nr:helix-turn-helix domain-containing protein [Psychromonas ossibalaenae]
MNIKIAIIDYPGSLKSAVYGLSEMFKMASRVSFDQNLVYQFVPEIIDHSTYKNDQQQENPCYAAVIVPPCDDNDYFLNPEVELISWLVEQHNTGAVLTSACAGSFILAATGLLKGTEITTHWALQTLFQKTYPQLALQIDQLLINKDNFITAAGMLSWLDLGLEIVTRFSRSSVMRQLGKMLVVDTGKREQRYYKQFAPSFSHGDHDILGLQIELQTIFNQSLTIHLLAQKCSLTERTFLRRFIRATQLKPTQYIQRLRIQKACDLLETSENPFAWIALQVGYEDVSACRKIFIRVIGLTPSEFRTRFVRNKSQSVL